MAAAPPWSPRWCPYVPWRDSCLPWSSAGGERTSPRHRSRKRVDTLLCHRCLQKARLQSKVDLFSKQTPISYGLFLCRAEIESERQRSSSLLVSPPRWRGGGETCKVPPSSGRWTTSNLHLQIDQTRPQPNSSAMGVRRALLVRLRGDYRDGSHGVTKSRGLT